MPNKIDRVLSAAMQRPISAQEHALVAAYLRDLEGRQARHDDVLEKALKQAREDLANCRRLLRKYDINEVMD